MFSRKKIGTTEAQINKQQHLNQEKLTKQKGNDKHCKDLLSSSMYQVPYRYSTLFYTKKYPGTGTPNLMGYYLRDLERLNTGTACNNFTGYPSNKNEL